MGRIQKVENSSSPENFSDTLDSFSDRSFPEDSCPNSTRLSCTTSPNIIIAPPTALDNQSDCFKNADCKQQKNIVYRVLDILKGARPGSDLTQLNIPAQLNLPKSQIQCYAEQVYCSRQKLLEKCADGASPMERFLAVLAWRFSMVRPVPYCKVPYNPILGETHHVTSGDLNVIAEQVSHHPPITVLRATNAKKGIEFFQLNRPVPKFCGNSVEVSLFGRQTLRLAKHEETYELTPPKLTFRFLPYVCSEWTGDTVVRCMDTDLEATVNFKPRSFMNVRGASNKVCGTIRRTTSPEKVLYKLSGYWDKTVTLEDVETGKKSVLYDSNAALTNLKAPVVKNLEELSPMDSVFVWKDLTKGLWNQNWEKARKAKLKVEEAQRALRQKRAEAGDIWEPRYFTESVGKEWVWGLKSDPVPEGPIVWNP